MSKMVYEMKRDQEGDSVRVRNSDILRLKGPSADAVVAIFGAMSWVGATSEAASVVLIRGAAILGHPADERAGENGAHQE